jgi:hypothetical protein
LTLFLTAALLFAYPDSVRYVGTTYDAAGPIGGNVGCARVTVRGPSGRLHIVYSKAWGASGADSSDIFEVESDDDGVTWSPMRDVSRDGYSLSTRPALAIDSSGTLHCCWFQFWNGSYDFYYARCDGDTWSIPRNISRMASNTNYAEYSSICVDANNRVHVAFEIVDAGHPDIYYTTPDGDSWLTPVLVSNSTLDDGFPCIASDSRSRLHLCWRTRASDSGYIMYSMSDSAWQPPRRIAACPVSVNSASLAIGPGDTAYLVYAGQTQSGRNDVFYMQSVDDMWTRPMNLSSSDPAWSNCPGVSASEDGTVCVVWAEGPETEYAQAMCRFRVDGNWQDAIDLSDDPVNGGYSTRVGSQMDNGHVDVAWVGFGLQQLDQALETTYVYYMRATVPSSGIAEAPAEGSLPATGQVDCAVSSGRVLMNGIPSGAIVRVYDVAARLVKDFGQVSSGYVDWEVNDKLGRHEGTGVYFVHVLRGRLGQVRKVVIVN